VLKIIINTIKIRKIAINTHTYIHSFAKKKKQQIENLWMKSIFRCERNTWSHFLNTFEWDFLSKKKKSQQW
jgi:hypothetical protein